MPDINAALAASKEAIEQLIVAGERSGPAWTSSRAPGKWSPSQIVEHVARSLEESANVAAGRPSKFPKLPGVVHPIVRGLLLKRVLRKAAFPKAKTNKAMDPMSGPATVGEGRVRLEMAHQKFAEVCRQTASHGERMRTTIFGAVRVEDYVRFMELHTRHHGKQRSTVSRWCPWHTMNRSRIVFARRSALGTTSPNARCSAASPSCTAVGCAAESLDAI